MESKRDSDNREFVDQCFKRLREDLGVFGPSAVSIIIETLGGLQVYVPSQRTLEREERDLTIWRAWEAGYSFEQIYERLRRHWPELTVDRVRRIVKAKQES